MHPRCPLAALALTLAACAGSAAGALLVRGDRIEAVGADADLPAQRTPGTTLIDLHGRTLMPGFVDAHTHVDFSARPRRPVRRRQSAVPPRCSWE
jgi:predicted amidohydrolase YtcJ